jgi:hypothetical protein
VILNNPTPTPTPVIRTRPPVAPAPAPSNLVDHLVGGFGQQYIAPPTQLQNTGDTNVCADHGGLAAAFACAAAFQAAQLVLIWNWQSPDEYHDPANPTAQYTVIKDIQGFRVYQLVPSFDHRTIQRDLVWRTTAGKDVTLTVLDAPQTVGVQSCYVVRAYRGDVESKDSPAFCIGNGQQPTTETILLPPAFLRTIRHAHHSPLDLPSCPALVGLVVGYAHCNSGLDQEQEVSRILVKFDLSSLGPVFNATLRFHRDASWLMGTDPLDNNQPSDAPQDEPLHGRTDANCASEVLLPTYDWVTNGWNDSDPDAAPPVTNLPTVDFAPVPLFAADASFDVTDRVLRWREFPLDNNGFALRGSDEYTSEEDNNRCVSQYSNFALQVTHLPSAAGDHTLIDPGTVVVPGAP